MNQLKLSRSSYYYQLNRLRSVDREATLKKEIKAIFKEHKGRYGYRRICLELRNRGYHINHKKVQRLLRVLGLKATIRRKRHYSSYRGEVGKKQIISFKEILELINLIKRYTQM